MSLRTKSSSISLQMKAIEHYFPAVLYTWLHKVILTFKSMRELHSNESVTIQMKAVKKYFPVVLFIMLYKMFLSFESVAEILTYDHSNESSIF